MICLICSTSLHAGNDEGRKTVTHTKYSEGVCGDPSSQDNETLKENTGERHIPYSLGCLLSFRLETCSTIMMFISHWEWCKLSISFISELELLLIEAWTLVMKPRWHIILVESWRRRFKLWILLCQLSLINQIGVCVCVCVCVSPPCPSSSKEKQQKEEESWETRKADEPCLALEIVCFWFFSITKSHSNNKPTYFKIYLFNMIKIRNKSNL